MKAIVTGDAEYAAHSFDDLPPGAHVAVRASPSQLPDSGVALRLSGFEIRDTIAHIVGDRIVWWVLARKPLDGTVAANVLAHGVGGLNIDASRVGTDEDTRRNAAGGDNGLNGESTFKIRERRVEDQVRKAGRFPANVLLDEHAAAEMDEQSGNVNGVIGMKKVSGGHNFNVGEHSPQQFPKSSERIKDSGGASRFFPLLDEDEAENWIRRLIDPDQSA